MRGKPKEAGRDLRLYARILSEARPHWWHVGWLFLLSLLATPVALLTPLPLKIAVDSVLGSHPVPGFLDAILPPSATDSDASVLIIAALMFVAIALLDQAQKLSSTVLGTYTGEKLQLAFRSRLFRHVQRLSLAYHDTRGTADAVYRIQYDAGAIQWVAVYGVAPFVTAALTLAGMIFVTARIDSGLAAIALAVLPALIAFTWISTRRLRVRWTTTKSLESGALGVVQEVLTGLRVVKAFGQEDREQERFLTKSGASVAAHVRISAVEGLFSLLVALTTAVGTAAVLYVGVRHVEAGTLTLGELLLVMGYLVQLYLPLQLMSNSVATMQESLASAERAFAILDEEPDVDERPDALPIERARGEILCEGVSFAYGPGEPVLDHVTFAVQAGSRVGVFGRTGEGKTTLANLLARFFDPTEGRILLDGVDLRRYRLADLRNQFAIVLQEPVLFSATVAENIAYARPEATEGQIVHAACAANAHDFITALPDEYGTLVGERGMRLSGGERQRISLARAFLKDAPVLILDEPTSSVDFETEAVIIEAMERLMKGRTTFVIAHRLSTLDQCDTWLEVKGGWVVVHPMTAPDDRWLATQPG